MPDNDEILTPEQRSAKAQEINLQTSRKKELLEEIRNLESNRPTNTAICIAAIVGLLICAMYSIVVIGVCDNAPQITPSIASAQSAEPQSLLSTTQPVGNSSRNLLTSWILVAANGLTGAVLAVGILFYASAIRWYRPFPYAVLGLAIGPPAITFILERLGIVVKIGSQGENLPIAVTTVAGITFVACLAYEWLVGRK